MKKIVFLLIACAFVALISGCGKVCEGPHNEVIDEAVAPTCDKSGLTEGKHCADCGTVIVKQEKIAPAHDYVDEVVQPSMLEGKYLALHCSLCGEKLSERYSVGLEITPDDETMTCLIKGRGECNDREIKVSPVIDGYKVVGVAKRAFSGERKITSITFSDGIKTLGDYAFAACDRLVNVVLPDGVTDFGAHTFTNCGRLKTVIIPDGVVEIEIATFFECGSLENVVIPASVKEIGTQAFSSCNLKRVFYYGTQEEWEKVKLEYGNGSLTPAGKYYYSETKPSVSDVYWHFVDGVPTVW